MHWEGEGGGAGVDRFPGRQEVNLQNVGNFRAARLPLPLLDYPLNMNTPLGKAYAIECMRGPRLILESTGRVSASINHIQCKVFFFSYSSRGDSRSWPMHLPTKKNKKNTTLISIATSVLRASETKYTVDIRYECQ